MPDERRVSLDALLADPRTVVDQVSPEQAAALLGRLSSVQALLVERLATSRVAVVEDQPSSPAAARAAPSPAWGAADLLTAGEVAGVLKTSVRFVYRHAGRWPFTRRISRKCLRFDHPGLLRFLAKKGVPA